MREKTFFSALALLLFILYGAPVMAKVVVENGSPIGSAHHQFFYTCFELEFRALGGEESGGDFCRFTLVVAEEAAAIPSKEALYFDGQIEPLIEMASEKIMHHPRAFFCPLNLWAREWAKKAFCDLRQRAQKAAKSLPQ